MNGSLPVTVETFDLRIDVAAPMTFIVPAQRKSALAQVHYFVDTGRGKVTRVEIDMAAGAAMVDPQLWGSDEPPLDLSLDLWKFFCIGPHSVTPRGNMGFLIGQRAFPCFLYLDLNSYRAELTPRVDGDGLLSCTNWIDPSTGAVWFASWSAEDMVRRIYEPLAEVYIRLWHEDENGRQVVWEGSHGDFLHQVLLTPDRRIAIITEMGMRPVMETPPGHPGNHPGEWLAFRAAGMVPSKLLFLNLQSGDEWRLTPPAGTPAHVELDPLDPSRALVSCHNVALVNGANVLFGPGTLTAYRLNRDGPVLEAQFSHPHFFRITSHAPFLHRGQLRVAVTGFPHRVFVLDGDLKLVSEVELFDAEMPDTDRQPHFCRHEPRAPYGIAPTPDGEQLIVAGSGYIWIVDVAKGRAVGPPIRLFVDPDDEVVAGHLTVFDSI